MVPNSSHGLEIKFWLSKKKKETNLYIKNKTIVNG
jgi:hypothetical protein